MSEIKRWLLGILLVGGLLLFGHSAQASETKVIDQANLFSKEEIRNLEEQARTFIQEADMDAVIVTTSDAQGKTAEAYADDFYDQGSYGIGTEKSGLLFLIDMDNRTYHISTAGHMIELLTDQRIERMLDHAEGDMRNDDYAAAATSVLKDSLKYGQAVKYDDSTGTFKKVHRISFWEGVIAAIAAVIAGVVSFLSVYGTYNLKRSTYSYSYRNHGHLSLKSKEDQLVNTATTSRYIPPAKSGGGGSSTHSSSGGSSHGGGGRSF